MQSEERSEDRTKVFSREFRDDLHYWAAADKQTLARVLDLIDQIVAEPFSGPGRPEELSIISQGLWSRRLSEEHRIVYLVGAARIDFLQARYHY